VSELSFGGGRYVVRRELGKGGQKIVYLVHDRTLNRECALALLDRDVLRPEDVTRLRNEAQTLARMGTTPHVVAVHDMGEDNGRPFIVCEYVSGGDLAELLRRSGALPIPRALAIARDISSGLAAAHERGIVHRDLKPSNVWMDENGRAKLGDFGIAIAHDRARLTATGSVTGTPAYCAPEQLNDDAVDGRTDLYALGCVMYELLTGRTPFSGTFVSVISQQIHAVPMPPSVLRPEISPDLDHLVLRLLAKNPGERPASAREASEQIGAVEAALDGDAGAPPHEREPSAPPPMTPRPLVTIAPTPPLPAVKSAHARRRLLLASAALFACGLAAWFALGPFRAEETPGEHRVAILALRPADVAPPDPKIAWTIALRTIEELDRYVDFRPVSAIGISIAKKAVLKDPDALPDEQEAIALAKHMGADTVVALSIEERDDLEVQGQVFATRDPASGVSISRVHLKRADLDATGPTQLPDQLIDGLKRQWRKSSLTKEAGVAPARKVSVVSFERSMLGEQHCIVGRFDLCEKIFRELLEEDPDNAFYLMKLACALSYQQKEKETEAVIKRAEDMAERLTSRRATIIYRQDRMWLEADTARQKNQPDKARAIGKQIIALDDELYRVYRDPIGLMYEAAATQFFLGDIPAARKKYAEVRKEIPTAFAAYSEEVRLLVGDGSNASNLREASKLLATFIKCFPNSEMIDAARSAWYQFHLTEPLEPITCPERDRG
jgi:tetratricopeptide (TPR) repeat protein